MDMKLEKRPHPHTLLIIFVTMRSILLSFYFFWLDGLVGGLDKSKVNLPTGDVSVVGRIGIGIRSKY